MNFADLGLSEDILKAVADAGYDTPTPIQSQAIPSVLMARDILGCAQTGTGKTASFTLPMLDILHHGRARMRMPRSIILEPTRELATQVAANFDTYGKYMSLSKALVIGGESFVEQQKILEKGADVIIATPGRLIDTFERGKLLLSDCKLLVIDEADRMLDMGFIPDIEKIVNMLPKQRQTLFFSATMPKEIRRLADKFLSNPKEITVSPPATMATTVEHKLLVLDDMDKREALRRLIRQENIKNAFVFCNRKKDVDILYKSLTKHGFNAGRMHGDLVQSERTETLDKFKTGEITLLICSDVAARGIDVADVSHVFNFDVPFNADDYVHRTGRTGRAGREGKAFTLAMPEDGKLVAAINKTINMEIPLTEIDGIETLELDFTGKKRRAKKSRKAPQRDDRPARDNNRDNTRNNGRDNNRNANANTNNRDDRAERDTKAAAPAPAQATPAPQEAKPQPQQQQPRENTQQRDARPRNERPNRPERSSGRSSSRRDRDDRHDRDDNNNNNNNKPIIGLGDHVPAFLLTPVPASSLGKPKAAEPEKKAPVRKSPAKAAATKTAKPPRTRTPRPRKADVQNAETPAAEAETTASTAASAPAPAPAPSSAPESVPESALATDAVAAKPAKPKPARRPRKKPAPKAAPAVNTDGAETGSPTSES